MSESTAESAETLPPPVSSLHADTHVDERFWSSVREALRGSHRDFTEGAVSRAILILAIPMVLEMVMESVFAVCDVFFVSKLGAAAVATVGLTESWLTLVYALANQSTRMAITASPAPRKMALMRNSMTIVMLPPSMMRA